MVNKVELLGRLGADPEVKRLENGTVLGKLSLCTTEAWTDNQGNKQEETSWHSIIMFGKLAENAERILQKGSLVYVDGKIKYRKAEIDGVTKYFTDISARDFRILADGKRNGEQSQQQTSVQQQAPVQQQQSVQQQTPVQQQAPVMVNTDDDLPF
jgi:single-strand DNA-binding protein